MPTKPKTYTKYPQNTMWHVALDQMNAMERDVMEKLDGAPVFIADDSPPPHRWHNKASRDKFNGTWRCMTPTYAVKRRDGGMSFLWLGGENAANDVENLIKCGVSARCCFKGEWGAPQSDDINDFQHVKIDDVLKGKMGWCAMEELMSEINDYLENEGSALLFCRQGARRAAVGLGVFLMYKTKCSSEIAYAFLKKCRCIVEPCVQYDLHTFEKTNYFLMGHTRFRTQHEVRPMPSVVPLREFMEIAKGMVAVAQRSAELDSGFVYSYFVSIQPSPYQNEFGTASGQESSRNDRSTASGQTPWTALGHLPVAESSTMEEPDVTKTQSSEHRLRATDDDNPPSEHESATDEDRPMEGDWDCHVSEISSVECEEEEEKKCKRDEKKRAPEDDESVGEWTDAKKTKHVVLGGPCEETVVILESEEMQQMKDEISRLRRPQSFEELSQLYGFIKDGDESNALRLLASPQLPDVQFFYDEAGMTMLHRAARLALPKVTIRLMELRANPNQLTDGTRPPRLWTALMCAADADWNKLDKMAASSTCKALANRMDFSGLCQQNDSKGNTWAHIAASHGNYTMLGKVLQATHANLGGKASTYGVLGVRGRFFASQHGGRHVGRHGSRHGGRHDWRPS
jgi:hypothetical protein